LIKRKESLKVIHNENIFITMKVERKPI